MKTILTAAFALVAVTSNALAGEAYELSDAQMDQVTAGSCGVGDQCFVGALDRAFSDQSGGLHDTTFGFVSIGSAATTPPGGGGGGGLFVVDDTIFQRGGAGQGGGCVISPCGP